MLKTMMNKPSNQERRTERRFDMKDSVSLRGWNLPLIAEPTSKSRAVEGKVQNVSVGGLCVLAKQPLKVSEMLVGEIAVPGTGASIPTLLQVRWLSKNPRGLEYRAGLHYVLQSGLGDSMKTPAGRKTATTAKGPRKKT